MKKRFIVLVALFCISASNMIAQDGEDAVWEPKKNITGYLSTEFDYFYNLDYFDRKYAASVSEAGLLASYQPLEKIAIKSVFVYRPNHSFDLMLNELHGEYTFDKKLKFKAGRFLTPLSPMNTYYYAPVNNSATLPMVISHHEFFPVNIDGLSLSGKIGSEYFVDYDVFGGGFKNVLWLKTGSIGMFGFEDDYMVMTQANVRERSTNNDKLSIGTGGHIGAGYNDIIDIGFGIFDVDEKIDITTVPAGVDTATWALTDEQKATIAIDKMSYGGDIAIKLSSFKLLGEAWQTTVTVNEVELDYKSFFVEASNEFSTFYVTPYVRYEFHTTPDIEYSRTTGGLSYRPFFSTIFKVEYMHYEHTDTKLDGVIGAIIFAF